MDSSEPLLIDKLKDYLGGKDMSVAIESTSHSPTPEVPMVEDAVKKIKLPELRSPEVNEVLSEPPSWLIQWGITVFFGVLLALFAISWFIQYPDLVNSSLRVVSTNAPKPISAKVEGRLSRLMVEDGQAVKQGTTLAFLESTGNHDEVLVLDKTVQTLIQHSISADFGAIHQTKIPLFFNLGELQKSYQAFQDAFVQSQSSLNNGAFTQKKSAIGRDIGSLRNLQSSTRRQLDLQAKDLQIALEEAQSQQRLADKGLVSKLDARNAQSRFLAKKQALEQAKNALENNSMNQNQKNQEVIDINKNINEQKNGLTQSIYALKSDIEAWKQRYIAISPIDGKVNFLSNLQENQTVKIGQDLLFITPQNTSYYGEILLGQYNFGKVKKGQEVLVKFQSYPYQEFGYVSGKIDYISAIPKDTAYLVKVIFPKGLTTSTNKKLPFINGMTASGEIITADRRLIERFFNDLLKVFRR